MLKRIPWASLLSALVAAALSVLGVRQLPPPSNPPPSDPPPPAVVPPSADPLAALGRLVMSGGYCSATPVTPIGKDAKQTLLSAAHCVKAVGEECQFFTRAGRMVRVYVTAIDRKADASLLVTEELKEPLPYLLVATETPPANSPVFQAGFGVDKPGNTEKGRILQRDTGGGQVMFEISVSPGDSGGGICVDGSGALISPVCCTTRLAQVGQVYGARPEIVRQMLLSPASFVDVPPQRMPERVPVEVKQ